MLVEVLFRQPANNYILQILGDTGIVERIQAGVYVVGSFNPEYYVAEPIKAKYPDIPFPHYGVVDSPEQIISLLPAEVTSSERRFAIFLTEVRRDEQPEEGGWRWHKWGRYLGEYKIQHEYLYDEDIEKVYCYHIYEF